MNPGSGEESNVASAIFAFGMRALEITTYYKTGVIAGNRSKHIFSTQ